MDKTMRIVQLKKRMVEGNVPVAPVHDPSEQAADVAADQVMRMPMSGAVFQGVSEGQGARGKGQGRGSESRVQSAALGGGGGGHPMDASTRQFMEGRFGANFGGVRLHTGSDAQGMSEGLRARAFTYGQDIYFNTGEYQPHSEGGRHLLAHELTHTLQQSPKIHRTPQQPQGKVKTQAEFAKVMAAKYGVTVKTGTEADQKAHFGTTNPLPNWKEWNPEIGGQTGMYEEILQAYADFAAAFGGTPSTKPMITFFRTYYARGVNDTFTEDPNTGGLTVPGGFQFFQATGTMSNFNATARSTAAGSATESRPRGSDITKGNVYHELGHGLESSIRASENTTVSDSKDIILRYGKAVGWASNFKLYDIGVKEVVDAINADKVPDARFQITQQNWNSGNWVEQPVTAYMVAGSDDDFAESVRVYLANPAILQSRSPTRYKFIHAMRTKNPGGLRTPTP
jgi:hypothetical protein